MYDQHIMLDIETLSVANDACVFAIGATRFDLDRILDERLWLIDLKTAQGRREAATMAWWASQDASLRDHLMSGRDSEGLVLSELAQFVQPFFEDHWVWGDPANFDLNILQTRYREIGLPYPFNWRNVCCAHTLQQVADGLGIDYSGREFSGFIAHDPLSDCIKQSYMVQIILKKMHYQFQPDGKV